MDEYSSIIERWTTLISRNPQSDPVPVLTELAILIERETENFLKLPIDPFDQRHPSRSWPRCQLGEILGDLLNHEPFTSMLTNEYIMSSNLPLQIISCRLLLDILPGLDAPLTFKETETLVPSLLEWAEKADCPLDSYATGLLASAMDVPEISSRYREQNKLLAPIMLNKLSQISMMDLNDSINEPLNESSRSNKRPHDEVDCDEQSSSTFHNECSNSSWAEVHMSGSYQMHPISLVMKQRFILQYLSKLKDYPELLDIMFDNKALGHILHFIDSRRNLDIRLTFDALKFLESFLPQKKFAIKFLDYGGLSMLLKVNKHGIASSGVGICLYYLAYNQDVMEKICWMKSDIVKDSNGTCSSDIVKDMVDYALWLLECSFDSSRVHATTFFSSCFQFPLILKLFDRQKGLLKLLNLISTRGILSDDIDELDEDEKQGRRNIARHVCVALKKFYRAHFVYERFKNQKPDQDRKPLSLSDKDIAETLELCRGPSPPKLWKFLDKMFLDDGIMYPLRIITFYCDEGIFFSGRSETVRNALEVLAICSFSPKVQELILNESIHNRSVMEILIMCTDSKISDADCQKSSLNILINLVSIKPVQPDLNISTPASTRKRTRRNHVDVSLLRNKIWSENGSMVLPSLLTDSPSSLTEADAVRSLACRVLCGLAEEDRIRQIMGKLPLFKDGLLQSLMKEPILPEKRTEHANFCESCKKLIELVTGLKVTSEFGISYQEIKRRQIVAKTKIEYDQNELLHLIYDHLISLGYADIAANLYDKAGLSSKPLVYSSKSRHIETHTVQQDKLNNSILQTPSSPTLPHRIIMNNESFIGNHLCTPKSATKNLQKSDNQPCFKDLPEPVDPEITLDTIVKEYCRYQHGSCRNPVALCPPFQLLTPHSCPEPSSKNSAHTNIATIISKRRIKSQKLHNAKSYRHYIYSKFRPHKFVRDTLDSKANDSTCCTFSNCGQYLFIGTETGVLKVFNIHSGVVDMNYDCHRSPLSHIQPADNLIITSTSISASPSSVLWTFTDIFVVKLKFENDFHAEFGKSSSDKIVSTQELFCRLWDVGTAKVVRKLESNKGYSSNKATFNYDDTIILHNDLLYDVRSGDRIHRFDGRHEHISGIFHPNGYEVIYNSEIWDLRNFRLLNVVPDFNQCELKFNTFGDVIFSTISDDQVEDKFKTSFRTFDAYDYTTIATIPLKKIPTDIAIQKGDELIAVIESHPSYAYDSSVCRLYEVGKHKYAAERDDEKDDDDDDVGDDEEDEDDIDMEDQLEDIDEDFIDIETGNESDSGSELSSESNVSSSDDVTPFNFENMNGRNRHSRYIEIADIDEEDEEDEDESE